jgi:hypothetical protein
VPAISGSPTMNRTRVMSTAIEVRAVIGSA